MFKFLFVALILVVCSCKTSKNKPPNSVNEKITIPRDSIDSYPFSEEYYEDKQNEKLFDIIVASYKIPEDPNTLSNLGVKDSVLKKILAPETYRLPQNIRSLWPHDKWTHARVYVMNFGNRDYPNNRLPIRAVQADSFYVQVINLSKEEALVALELQHRIASGIIHSKCPITVRHAVVFFDNKTPVGGTGICFECKEQLYSPAYYSLENDLLPSTTIKGIDQGLFLESLYEHYYSSWDYEEDSTIQKDSIWDITDLHFELIDKWQMFFDYVGAKKWNGVVKFEKEINTKETFFFEGNPFNGIAKTATQQGVFVNGKRNGYWKVSLFNSEGKKYTDFKGNYKENKRHGRFEYYKNYKRQNSYVEYYENGNLLPNKEE